MNLTLDIDDEIVAKVSKIAEARDMTVAEMVAEYLTGIATSPAASPAGTHCQDARSH